MPGGGVRRLRRKARVSWLRAAALAALFGALTAGCTSTDRPDPPSYDVRELRCRVGDDPAWSASALDDTAWPVVDNGSWPALRERGEVVWCRAGVDVPVDRPTAVWVQGGGSRDVWIDGTPVAQDTSGMLAGLISPIPSEAQADGRAQIAVRAWVDRRWTAQLGPSIGVAVGDPVALELAQLRGYEATLQQIWPGATTSAFALLIGLYHVAFHVRRPQLRGNLALGIGALTFGLNGLIPMAVNLGILPLFFGYRTLFFALLTIAYPALLLSVAQLFEGRLRFVAAWTALFAARSVFMLWWPVQANDVGLWHTLAVSLPALAYIIRGVWRSLRSGRAGARVLAAGALAFQAQPLAYAASLAVPAESPLRRVLDVVSALGLLAWLASVAWALSVERVVQAAEDLEHAYRSAARFVPDDFLRRLGRNNVRDVVRGDAARANLTLMFLDIRGFTTLAEANTPEVVFGLVNELLGRFDPIVRRHGGFIAQNTGDGFVALFETADGAVAAGLGIQASLAERRAQGAAFPVFAGIGLHSGSILLGTVGGGQFLAVGMVADAVNLTARIEGLSKTYGAPLLVSSETAGRLGPAIGSRLLELDRVVVKGRSQSIGLVEVRDAPVDANLRARFDAARAAYNAGEFSAAEAAFVALTSEVRAATTLAERCHQLGAQPPEAWDGAWRLDHK